MRHLLLFFFFAATMAATPRVSPLDDAKKIYDLGQIANPTLEESRASYFSTSIGYIPDPLSERHSLCTVLSFRSTELGQQFITDKTCLSFQANQCSGQFFYFWNYYGYKVAFECSALKETSASGLVLVTGTGPSGRANHDEIPLDPLVRFPPRDGATILVMYWDRDLNLRTQPCNFHPNPENQTQSFLADCSKAPQGQEPMKGAAIIDAAHAYTLIGILSTMVPNPDSKIKIYTASFYPSSR